MEVGSVNVGFELIEQGLAIARYDSRDGYGSHPRENAYVPDAAADDYVCEPAPAPEPTPPPDPEPNCDPSYPTVCIPPPPPDLNCGDISARNFTVIGSDPHRFDNDNDGVGCEA